MIRHMDMVYIIIQMVLNTRVVGLKTNSMEEVLKHGLMERNTKVVI